MRCPNCQTTLVESTDTKEYETMEDHVFDPNMRCPARTYFYCPNKTCELNSHAFWDRDGDFYAENEQGDNWYANNRVDTYNPSTHKNRGVEALDSFSFGFHKSCLHENKGLHKIRSRISSKWGNWSCGVRRRFLPTALWRDNSRWYRKLGFCLGVFMMDPLGNRWKTHARFKDPIEAQDDTCLLQWLSHPFPWIRRAVRRWLAGKTKLVNDRTMKRTSPVS